MGFACHSSRKLQARWYFWHDTSTLSSRHMSKDKVSAICVRLVQMIITRHLLYPLNIPWVPKLKEYIYHMSTDHVDVGQAYSLSRIRLGTLWALYSLLNGHLQLPWLGLSQPQPFASSCSYLNHIYSRDIGIKEVMVSSTVSTSKSYQTTIPSAS